MDCVWMTLLLLARADCPVWNHVSARNCRAEGKYGRQDATAVREEAFEAASSGREVALASGEASPFSSAYFLPRNACNARRMPFS
eukprot:3085811-Rhodomonas_salina.4